MKTDQTDRNVLEVKILILQKNIEQHLFRRSFIKHNRLQLHPSLANVLDDKRGIMNKGKCTISHLKPCIHSLFIATGHCSPNLSDCYLIESFTRLTLGKKFAILRHKLPALYEAQLEINRTQHENSNSHAGIHSLISIASVLLNI